MDEQQILAQINTLAHEEHELFERESSGRATEEDVKRLRELQTTLDQCWDFLRQWRARREFGQSTDDVHIRDKKTVERYSG
jgi:Protein of unknown function (DUF2630)